jgi:hypothetical protein
MRGSQVQVQVPEYSQISVGHTVYAINTLRRHSIYFKGCLNFLLHLFHLNNAALFFRYSRSKQKKILQFMCKVHNHVWSIIMVCLH